MGDESWVCWLHDGWLEQLPIGLFCRVDSCLKQVCSKVSTTFTQRLACISLVRHPGDLTEMVARQSSADLKWPWEVGIWKNRRWELNDSDGVSEKWCAPRVTPWKYYSEFTPENRPGPKRKGLSSNHHFSGAIFVSFLGVVQHRYLS